MSIYIYTTVNQNNCEIYFIPTHKYTYLVNSIDMHASLLCEPTSTYLFYFEYTVYIILSSLHLSLCIHNYIHIIVYIHIQGYIPQQID